MLYQEPSPKEYPLSPQEAADLREKTANVLKQLMQNDFNPEAIEKIVHRLLTTTTDLAIYTSQYAPVFKHLPPENHLIVSPDLRELENLIALEKKMLEGESPKEEEILLLFTNDDLGHAFIQASQAACRLKELKQPSSRKNQNVSTKQLMERAQNNLLHLMHELKILSTPTDCYDSYQKRIAYYKEQMRKLTEALGGLKKIGVEEKSIERTNHLIKSFDEKIEQTKLHRRVAEEILATNLDPKGKNAKPADPRQTSLFDNKGPEKT